MAQATESEALALLDKLQISYQKVDHPALWTMADEKKLAQRLPRVKNLFLKLRKSQQYYLYLTIDRPVNFKTLAYFLGVSHSKLVFATPAELKEILGLVPGMVTPLALMHDQKQQVTVLLDVRLQQLPAISAHPNINTATILLSYADLLKILQATGHAPLIVTVKEA